MVSAHPLLTVVVTASVSPLHPSTAILRETLLSLQLLRLPSRTEVLLSHDGPRAAVTERTAGISPEAFPPAYLAYLSNVRQLLPAAQACTGLMIRLLLRASPGGLAGNLEFALSHVRTPFFLKVEHDHPFVREIDIESIVEDMMSDRRLRNVRFNRRENKMERCDAGEVNAHRWRLAWTFETARAQALWRLHESAPGASRLRNQYIRTGCFSDMNHLASTDYYRSVVLPIILKSPTTPPETLMQQQLIARDHSRYGTYVYGAMLEPRAIVHVDAALRASPADLGGYAYLWLTRLKGQLENRTGAAAERESPFRCRHTEFRGIDRFTTLEQLPSELQEVMRRGRRRRHPDRSSGPRPPRTTETDATQEKPASIDARDSTRTSKNLFKRRVHDGARPGGAGGVRRGRTGRDEGAVRPRNGAR